MDYEKVATGIFVEGIIEEVQYQDKRLFKGFEGAADSYAPAARFKFAIDGRVFPHYSRWMKFSLHSKATLYKKYVTKLVEDAYEYMDFDFDAFNGMRVKTIWSDNGDFQDIDLIAPLGEKLKVELIEPENTGEPCPKEFDESVEPEETTE